MRERDDSHCTRGMQIVQLCSRRFIWLIYLCSRQGKGIFPSANGDTGLTIQWVSCFFLPPSPRVKRGEGGGGGLPLNPSTGRVKNAWICINILPYIFMAWCLITHRDNWTFLTFCICRLENFQSILIAYFLYFKIMEVGSCYLIAVCVSPL